MANLEKKSFDNPDEVKAPEKTNAAVVNFGTVAASRVVLQPGWKWSDDIKPVVGTDSCKAKHLGVIVQGSITCRHDDGTQITYTAGDAYAIEPGHDAWVEGNSAAIAYEFHGAWGD
ncbi:MAG: cupin domain-containing protein [Rhodobacteraceae bacterium]|nr:cupin domain-containing protein [Paracoccaceae bacterium]